MENTSLNYLTKVLGVRYIPKLGSSKTKIFQRDKITLVAHLDCEDVVQVRDFEKLKELLNSYGVLGSVLVNPTDLNKDGLETGIRQKKPTSRLAFASLASPLVETGIRQKRVGSPLCDGISREVHQETVIRQKRVGSPSCNGISREVHQETAMMTKSKQVHFLPSLGSPYHLILSLGRPSLNGMEFGELNGIWNRVGDQMIMATHPVSEFGNRGVKAIVWRDVKRAIRMCGVEV